MCTRELLLCIRCLTILIDTVDLNEKILGLAIPERRMQKDSKRARGREGEGHGERDRGTSEGREEGSGTGEGKERETWKKLNRKRVER